MLPLSDAVAGGELPCIKMIQNVQVRRFDRSRLLAEVLSSFSLNKACPRKAFATVMDFGEAWRNSCQKITSKIQLKISLTGP